MAFYVGGRIFCFFDIDRFDTCTIKCDLEQADELKARYTFTEENAKEILQREVGAVFATVLEHAGVYKCTPEGREAFLRFVQSV